MRIVHPKCANIHVLYCFYELLSVLSNLCHKIVVELISSLFIEGNYFNEPGQKCTENETIQVNVCVENLEIMISFTDQVKSLQNIIVSGFISDLSVHSFSISSDLFLWKDCPLLLFI